MVLQQRLEPVRSDSFCLCCDYNNLLLSICAIDCLPSWRRLWTAVMSWMDLWRPMKPMSRNLRRVERSRTGKQDFMVKAQISVVEGQGDGSFVFFVVPVEAIISSCWLSPTNPFNNGLADRSQPRKLSYGHAN